MAKPAFHNSADLDIVIPALSKQVRLARQQAVRSSVAVDPAAVLRAGGVDPEPWQASKSSPNPGLCWVGMRCRVGRWKLMR